jgi:hypothetical protein
MKLRNFRWLCSCPARILALVLGANLAASTVHADSHVVAWGFSPFGQTNVPPGLSNVVAIANGGFHRLALKADGTIFAWADFNLSNELTIPPAGLSHVVAIAAGANHSLALRADGTVVGWGDNSDGEARVPPDLTNAVAIATGLNASLALRADGTVVAWGSSAYGRRNVPAGLMDVTAIAVGQTHSLALRADGTVIAWGAGRTNSGNFPDFGQSAVPAGLTNVVAIAAGQLHSLALKADGIIVAWGAYNTSPFYLPARVPESISNVVAIAADRYNLFLTADGTVMNWPMDGATDFTNVLAIATSDYLNMALVGDGPPVLRAQMTNPKSDANGFSCSLSAQSGRVYRLEYKDSLIDPDWTALPLVAGSGGAVTLTDSTATGSQRFYRVRRW